jgi:hypothetical protein
MKYMTNEIRSQLHTSAMAIAAYFGITALEAEAAARRCWEEEPALHDWLLSPNTQHFDGETITKNYMIFQRDYLIGRKGGR